MGLKWGLQGPLNKRSSFTMKARNLSLLSIAVILTIGMITFGCSGKSKLLTEVSGQWQDNQDHAVVGINLVGDNKSVTVGGQAYPVSVEKVEAINYLVQLKVQNGSAEPESWTIKELWDENGASFKLSFDHNGKNDILIPKAQS
jgi:hypothetical protein